MVPVNDIECDVTSDALVNVPQHVKITALSATTLVVHVTRNLPPFSFALETFVIAGPSVLEPPLQSDSLTPTSSHASATLLADPPATAMVAARASQKLAEA